MFYRVAGHTFVFQTGSDDSPLSLMQQYQPFEIAATEEPVAFRLQVIDTKPKMDGFEVEVHQEDEGQEILAGRKDGHPCFLFTLRGNEVGWLTTNDDYSQGQLYMEHDLLFAANNALMVMYALATSNQQTALFHSSVVSYQGKAYMFLGKSGTGKSTHSKLWLKHIEGTELVNDDNPVVRFLDGEARLYGSPWSGKTPCYRNVDYPLGGIVLLSQAPENKIERLKGVNAYAAVMTSISGKRWDRRLADGLHETENLLAQKVPIYHLDCLPDEAAALLSCKTCTDGH